MAFGTVVELEVRAIHPNQYDHGYVEHQDHLARLWEVPHSAQASYEPVTDTVVLPSDWDQTKNAGSRQVVVVPRRPAAPQEGVHSSHFSLGW